MTGTSGRVSLDRGNDLTCVTYKVLLVISDWIGRLTVRFMLWSNLVPEFDDPAGVIASRFIALKGTKSWFGREDHELAKRLKTELSGILNWSIVGLRRLQKRGYFIQPDSGREIIEQMEEGASPILSFVKERCVKKGWIEKDRLFAEWKNWCETNEKFGSMGTKETFGTLLLTVFPTVTRRQLTVAGKRTWVYDGISLRDDTGSESRRF